MSNFTPILNKTFDLYSNDISVHDKYGTSTRAEVLESLNVPCYMTKLRGDLRSRYGKISVDADYVFFTNTIDVCDNWIILFEGNKYHIKYVHASGLEHSHHYEILVKRISEQSALVEYGWTWGEENPEEEYDREVWPEWVVEGSLVEARNSGDYGELELEHLDKFCSDVKDTGGIFWKTLEISYDDYDYGDYSGTKKLYWRGSNTSFSEDDVSISWNEYTGSVKSDLRYLQIMTEIE